MDAAVIIRLDSRGKQPLGFFPGRLPSPWKKYTLCVIFLRPISDRFELAANGIFILVARSDRHRDSTTASLHW